MENRELTVQTPLGTIRATPATDPDNPGIYIEVCGQSLVLVEYDDLNQQESIKVWDHNAPFDDPDYTQAIKEKHTE